MNRENPLDRLRSLPVQLVDLRGEVVVKRGRVEARIQGVGGAPMVARILEATAHAGATAEEIEQSFEPSARPVVRQLIGHLLGKGLLTSVLDSESAPAEGSGESRADVFYWQFGKTEQDIADRLREKRIQVLGVNTIALRLVQSLAWCGIRDVEVIDVPTLRNPTYFEADGSLRSAATAGIEGLRITAGSSATVIDPELFDCLVATSEDSGLGVLGPWNELCHLHDRLFLPVVLSDSIGYVGPLVAWGETACLECVVSRLLTHSPEPHVRRAVDAAASAADARHASLPPMASCLGDVAAMELVKFLGLGPGVGRAGVLIEVDLVAGNMTPRPVLRMPRCPVCSPIHERPLTPPGSQA